METRPFGKTGESFPILSFGGQRIVDDHDCNEEESIEIVNTAIDRGIRYFDTAISYTYAESQAILGEALEDVRDDVFITTKVDFWDLSKPDGQITKVDKEGVAR